jgi:hypothetical protein
MNDNRQTFRELMKVTVGREYGEIMPYGHSANQKVGV